MEISKNKIKFVTSLSLKKNRDINKLFVGEGSKLVLDLLPFFRTKYLFCTKEWHCANIVLIENANIEEVVIVDKVDDLKKISQMTTASPVVAVFYKKDEVDIKSILSSKDIILVIDSIQDPGNLGTIIRTADWFGIKYILCSEETVDVYNSKVVNSTMGAIARVDLVYVDITSFIFKAKDKGKKVYGTFLNGENIYESNICVENALIIMGNEGNGISAGVERHVDTKLTIPSFAVGDSGSESLNVAIATSILLSEFRRR